MSSGAGTAMFWLENPEPDWPVNDRAYQFGPFMLPKNGPIAYAMKTERMKLDVRIEGPWDGTYEFTAAIPNVSRAKSGAVGVQVVIAWGDGTIEAYFNHVPVYTATREQGGDLPNR